MTPLLSVVLAASTIKSIGVVIAVLVVIGFVVYVIINVRSGRAEAGSEIELAPNRKPYFDDAGARGTQARPLPPRRLRADGCDRHRPAPLLAQRARSPGRSHRGVRPSLRRPEARSCSPPQPMAASTAPAATARVPSVGPRPTRSPTRTMSSSPRSTGRPRRCRRCCCASRRRRCATSSSTAGLSRRCRRGASREAARSTSNRSTTSSPTSHRSSSPRRSPRPTSRRRSVPGSASTRTRRSTTTTQR